MTPLTFITGVLLGTAASICFGLIVVLFLFALLGSENPQVNTEMGSLAVSAVIFLLMTAVCAASFVALLKQHRWRWLGQGAMWAGVVAIATYYLA